MTTSITQQALLVVVGHYSDTASLSTEQHQVSEAMAQPTLLWIVLQQNAEYFTQILALT